MNVPARWMRRGSVIGALVGASALLASLGAVPASATPTTTGTPKASLPVPPPAPRTPAPSPATSPSSPAGPSSVVLNPIPSGSSTPSSVAPNVGLGNPAGCELFIADAHIARSVSNAVKVNAQITCKVPVQAMALQVNLYKNHIFNTFGELQASTTTYDTGRQNLRNFQTFRKCTNSKSTEWYGQAVAVAEENGQLYEASLSSPHTATLKCGT